MLILGFGNKARQGKDTAAEAIRDHYHLRNISLKNAYGPGAPQTRVQIYKYATALYEEVNGALEHDIWHTRRVIAPSSSRGAFVFLPDWVQPDLNFEKSSL